MLFIFVERVFDAILEAKDFLGRQKLSMRNG